jgi:hypothetical protein
VFDAIEIEKRGIPTLTICHDRFEIAFHMHAEILGMPEIPLLIEPAPKGGTVSEDTAHIVKENINVIIKSLTATVS